MTAKQVMSFLANEDTTTNHYRRFNLSPKDSYPTFSICFTGSEFYWYKGKEIFKVFGLKPSEFEAMLKGQEVFRYDYNYSSMLYNKIPVDPTLLGDLDIKDYYLKLTDILTGLEFRTLDDITNIEHGKGKPGKMQQILFHDTFDKMFFRVGFNTPDTICFTRRSRDLLNTQRVKDELFFNTSILGRSEFQNVDIQIFVHYPQQLMRSFHKPAFKWTVGLLNQIHYNDLKISISKVTTLRKRPGANVPCDEHLENDDGKLQQQIIDRIQCIPPYWKSRGGKHSLNPTCNLGANLQNAYGLIRDYKNILKSYHSPCVQMEILTKYKYYSVRSKKGKDPRVIILYEETDYEELTNMQDFDFESLVSGVGGFIGIFLGYSILQIPDLLELLPPSIFNLRLAAFGEGKPACIKWLSNQ